MKILIKGAGDLATGIASRLYGAGHQILMTEIAQPPYGKENGCFVKGGI